MTFQILINNAVTGQNILSPKYSIYFDWHIALGIELLASAFMVGFVEELFFRGLIYQALRRRFSLAITVLLSAGIFALFHPDYILNPLSLSYVFFMGIIAATLFEHTRSLTNCICFHIAGNATEIMINNLYCRIPAQ